MGWAIPERRTRGFAVGFLPPAIAVAVTSAALAGLAPRAFSIVTVFLFAGPHNWLEARYFMARLPGRFGPLRGYFALGVAGVVTLAIGSAALPWLGSHYGWQTSEWVIALATWETSLVVWTMALIWMRSRQKPLRDWSLAWPIGFSAIAFAWVSPAWWGLALVYAHPLVALAVLDRELKRNQPEWRKDYHRALVAVPVLLVLLAGLLAHQPDLSGDDPITTLIARHAGADLLAGVSSHLLVATHTFLDMLHYGIWIVAIPLISLRSKLWQVASIPLARGSIGWRRLLRLSLLLGLMLVILLWAGFLADYPTTRDVYFTVALLHVLAEIPFLLRML